YVLVEEEVRDGEVRVVDEVRGVEGREARDELGVVEAELLPHQPGDWKEERRHSADEEELEDVDAPAPGARRRQRQTHRHRHPLASYGCCGSRNDRCRRSYGMAVDDASFRGFGAGTRGAGSSATPTKESRPHVRLVSSCRRSLHQAPSARWLRLAPLGLRG